MHKFLYLIVSFAGLFLLALPKADAADAAKAGSLSVMTFNLRYASDRQPNSWAERRPVMRQCLLDSQPDLIGTQEGVYHQLKDLHRDLPGYSWIGLGRDGGSHGEFMAVFYKEDRFEPLEYDHFWLSDTPDVVASSTWGNSNKRMLTWVRFRDRTTNQEFIFANTHFDHAIQLAREKSADLVRDRIGKLAPELPLFLVGDFNAKAGENPAYHTLVTNGPFKDAWELADRREGEELNTFNGFKTGPHTGGNRIDWILLRGAIQVQEIEIDPCQHQGQYPSDHFPVTARIHFKN